MMQTNPIFSQQFEIQSHHIAQNFEATLPFLLGCLQHTAELHVDSEHIGWQDLHIKGCFWAIYRMGLQIQRMPKKYETITVRTWANAPKRFVQPRYFEVLDSQQQCLIRAESLWIILHNKTFQPLDIEQVIGTTQALSPTLPTHPINLKIGSIATKNHTPTVCRRVLYSDIDTNQHVNNTNYVRWFIDSFPLDFLTKHRLNEIVINYTQQAMLGDDYAIFTHYLTPNVTLTAIMRGSTELCKIKAQWEAII